MTMKDHDEGSESGDSASTDEANFKRLERRIEEVAQDQKEPILKIGEAVSPFTAPMLKHPLPDLFRMPSILMYDGNTDPGDHLYTFSSWMLLHGAGPELMCQTFYSPWQDLPSGGTKNSGLTWWDPGSNWRGNSCIIALAQASKESQGKAHSCQTWP